MSESDYARLQDAHGGEHIARRGDKIVASADTLGELLRILTDKGLVSEDVVVEFVRPKGVVYAL